MVSSQDGGSHRWPLGPEGGSPLPSRSAVHIWAADLDRSGREHAALTATLSPDEGARAARFRHETHARRFINARGTLRTLLGRYLDRDPSGIQFRYTAGKPALADPGREPLHFNLAHADELALFAFTTAAEVGVDVERVAALPDARDIAVHYFAPDEIGQFMRAPDEAAAFFRCWTRKEAFVKATGTGLAHPLHAFTVTVSADEPAAVVAVGDDPMEAPRWFMHHLEPAPGFLGAVAVRATIQSVNCWRWEPPPAG